MKKKVYKLLWNWFLQRLYFCHYGSRYSLNRRNTLANWATLSKSHAPFRLKTMVQVETNHGLARDWRLEVIPQNETNKRQYPGGSNPFCLALSVHQKRQLRIIKRSHGWGWPLCWAWTVKHSARHWGRRRKQMRNQGKRAPKVLELPVPEKSRRTLRRRTQKEAVVPWYPCARPRAPRSGQRASLSPADSTAPSSEGDSESGVYSPPQCLKIVSHIDQNRFNCNIRPQVPPLFQLHQLEWKTNTINSITSSLTQKGKGQATGVGRRVEQKEKTFHSPGSRP